MGRGSVPTKVSWGPAILEILGKVLGPHEAVSQPLGVVLVSPSLSQRPRRNLKAEPILPPCFVSHLKTYLTSLHLSSLLWPYLSLPTMIWFFSCLLLSHLTFFYLFMFYKDEKCNNIQHGSKKSRQLKITTSQATVDCPQMSVFKHSNPTRRIIKVSCLAKEKSAGGRAPKK